jgi:mono/diheme cytochrome c family protein
MDNNRDEHNRGGFYAFIFSVVFCLIFFVYVSFVHKGVNLKEVPEGAMTDAPVAAAAVDVSKIDKPWQENAAMVDHGKKVFKNNCAICHGEQGKGDGPAGAALVPPARNLVEGKWKQGGTSENLFTTLQVGVPGGSMASFKHLPKNDRWALVQFIRSITTNKTPDDAAKLDAFAATAE